jgi:hypothetical protein
MIIFLVKRACQAELSKIVARHSQTGKSFSSGVDAADEKNFEGKTKWWNIRL